MCQFLIKSEKCKSSGIPNLGSGFMRLSASWNRSSSVLVDFNLFINQIFHTKKVDGEQVLMHTSPSNRIKVCNIFLFLQFRIKYSFCWAGNNAEGSCQQVKFSWKFLNYKMFSRRCREIQKFSYCSLEIENEIKYWKTKKKSRNSRRLLKTLNEGSKKSY